MKKFWKNIRVTKCNINNYKSNCNNLKTNLIETQFFNLNKLNLSNNSKNFFMQPQHFFELHKNSLMSKQVTITNSLTWILYVIRNVCLSKYEDEIVICTTNIFHDL